MNNFARNKYIGKMSLEVLIKHKTLLLLYRGEDRKICKLLKEQI